jgi:hypothetical protein
MMLCWKSNCADTLFLGCVEEIWIRFSDVQREAVAAKATDAVPKAAV